jgi:hypothetical protein
MRVVLVSSPGAIAAPHWSHESASALLRGFRASGADVEWFRSAREGDDGGLGNDAATHAWHVRPHRLDRVAAANRDPGLERAVSESLRRRPANALVHVGAGARGSPNLLWIAERLGSRSFAVVRSEEVVCHRGDLVDSAGRACATFDDADRCLECCAVSRWRHPRAGDFSNRWDLLIAGLASAAAVFVRGEADVERLVRVGVPRRILSDAREASEIIARVTDVAAR